MISAEKWMELIPEFGEIRDPALRGLSLKATQAAAEKGGWTEETIGLAPVTVSYPGCDCSLLEHVRKVVQTCIANYDLLGGFYERNGCPMDRDLIVCGALLHDIGKFTEFTMRGGEAVHSRSAALIRHPLAGAILAAETGLPDVIVNLIATHSFEGDRSVRTKEADFVRTIEDFVFRCSVAGLSKKGSLLSSI